MLAAGMYQNLQRGFTLIELMIVIGIIGILSAIAMPAYQDYTIRSQVSEGAILAAGAKVGMVEFYNYWGRWPSSNASAGLVRAASIRGKYVSSMNVATTTGKIAVTFGTPDVNKRINNSLLVFSGTAARTKGAINWNCRSNQTGATRTNIPNKYLPAVCRS